MTEKKNIIPLIPLGETKKVSRKQKMFNSRIKKINGLKEKIELAKKEFEDGKSRIAKELFPAMEKYKTVRFELVKLLDQAYSMKFFRRREKEKINDILLSVSDDLLEKMESEELLEIHNRHVDISNMNDGDDDDDDDYPFDEEDAREMEQSMKEFMLKQMMGIDVDLSDVEDLDDMDLIMKKIEEQQFEQKEAKAKHESTRKKSKAEEKRANKIKEEAKKISQISRKIYTRLVKMLHPDHEHDEEKKEWKTEAIKEVTEAYNKDDFFTLLRLQLHYFEKEEGSLEELNDDQLKYYNKILLEQIRELEGEYNSMTGWSAQGEFYRKYCGKDADRMIEREKQGLEREINMTQQDIDAFSNKKGLRGFLRKYKIQEIFSPFDFFFK